MRVPLLPLVALLLTLSLVPRGWGQAANPAKLMVFWDFNDASAPKSASDKLHGIAGAVIGSAAYTPDAAGRSGQAGDRAMDFQRASAGHYVRVSSAGFVNFAAAGDQITVSFWQKLYQVSASSSFWFVSPSSIQSQRGLQAHVPWSDSTLYFDSAGCCGSDTRVSANITAFPGYDAATWKWTNWHHFTYVKNGPVKQIWIDGQLHVDGDAAAPLPTDFVEINIGGGGTVGSGNVQGIMDDFAVFSSALEPAQIAQLAKGDSPILLAVDTDKDGMLDWWEDQFGFNKNVNDAAADSDSDGLSNLNEYLRFTDPKKVDSDGDGIRDGAETATGIWVSATDTGTNPLRMDSDGDGLADNVETNSGVFVNATNPGTNPVKSDTDADGFTDGVEVRFAGNPVDVSKNPLPVGIPKLLAWWDFNTTTDPEKANDKVYAIQGIITNGATYTTGRTGVATDGAMAFGVGGPAIRVNEGSVMNIAAVSNRMTVTFWQKLDDAAATSSAWAEQTAPGSRGFNVHVPWSDSVVYFDTGGTTAGSTRISANINRLPGFNVDTWDWTAWHHFAFVKNGNSKEIWVDGKLLIRGPNTTALPRDITRLWIGAQPNGAASVHGTLDDFAIFASALDEARIRELARGTAPNQLEVLTDTDKDGMPDIYEEDNGLNKLVNDAQLDLDNDGSTNIQEFEKKTNPNLADTDADGLKDSVETGTGVFASATNTGTDPLSADTDGDGLGDLLETNSGIFVSAVNPGTNPNLADTDADGVADGTEIALETSPVNAKASPIIAGALNLLAYWDFNTATDPLVAADKIHKFAGVFTNGVGFGGASSGRTAAVADQSLAFNSTTQAMIMTNAVFLNAAAAIDKMTVTFWQKLDNIAASSAFWMVSRSLGRGSQAHTPWSDSTIYFDTAGCCTAGTQRLNANLSTLPGYDAAVWTPAWHHFAFVKDGGTKQVWIDGKLFVAGSGANPLPTDFTLLMVGAEAPTAANTLQGSLDDFAVFASALSAAQIGELATGKLPTALTLGPTISVTRAAGKVTLTFTGTLESSDTLAAGSWTPVANATSPLDITVTQGQRFYRTRQ